MSDTKSSRLDDHEPTMRDLMREINRQGDTINRQGEMLRRLDQFVTGGERPAEGIVVRMDRIEQRGESSQWWARVALGASIVAVINAIVGYLKQHT